MIGNSQNKVLYNALLTAYSYKWEFELMRWA